MTQRDDEPGQESELDAALRKAMYDSTRTRVEELWHAACAVTGQSEILRASARRPGSAPGRQDPLLAHLAML